jgi:hypothetical protein
MGFYKPPTRYSLEDQNPLHLLAAYQLTSSTIA